MLENKKFVLIGDRDGIPGESLKNVVATINGSTVLLASTECAV